MKVELSLLENSYDYISNSFDLYRIANEDGVHDAQRSDYKNKVKWKLAFITLVQATELLLKEILKRIHPNLLYEDIDIISIGTTRTVSIKQTLSRINNFGDKKIEKQDIDYITNCTMIRNAFIHNEVIIKSEKMKMKYSMLYKVYNQLHIQFIGGQVEFEKQLYKYIEQELLQYCEGGVVFRGIEMKEEDMQQYKTDIEENKMYTHYKALDGSRVERFKFGDEINRVGIHMKPILESCEIYKLDICSECLAKAGEYHLTDCELEVCPICNAQLISCGCIAQDEDGNLVTSSIDED